MERKIGQEIRRLNLIIGRRVCQKEKSLTRLQCMIIGYIFKHKGENVYQKDIESFMNIRRSTATEIINTMVKGDLIKRESVENDKRLKRLVLTENSISLYNDIEQDINDTEKLMRIGIDADDLDIFFNVIDNICINLEALNG